MFSVPVTRPCRKCKQSLPLTSFSKDRTRKDGLGAICKTCMREYHQSTGQSRKVALQVEKVCIYCKKTFIASGKAVKYCSHSCCNKARSTDLASRFWPKVQKSDDPDACWLWTGAQSTNRYGGYGCIGLGTIPNVIERAHRVSWTLHHGKIPDDLQVLHKCDTPLCVNPDHLFLGTNADNVADKVSKNRQSKDTTPHGEDCPWTKLTLEQVRQIRAEYVPYSKYANARVLGERYGVEHSQILRIVHGIRWKDDLK